MAAIFPSFPVVQPSFMMPELIMNYQQASGAFEVLATGDAMPRLGAGDLYVYIKTLDIRTNVSNSQAANGNQLPSVTLDAGYRSTPTYLHRCRSEYDQHDTAAAANYNVALPEAYRLGSRQAIFQQMRNALLYGITGSNGEGLLNTNGATTATLPADSNGNTTLVTYDNGQLEQWFLSQIVASKVRMMQSGQENLVVILGPQRALLQLELQAIVQLTQYQRAGAGTSTVGQVIKEQVKQSGEGEVIFAYDDTLIGQGSGGTDAIVIVIPEIKVPKGSPINTNEFATLKPGLEATALMLSDMAAPREIPTPLPGGAIDIVSEMRTTPGWAIRPEAVTILSVQYS
jgi:hypothetical protein